MALRLLLVTVVAGMGFELPSGPDLSSWNRSGRDWVNARMAELSGVRAEAERALAGAIHYERLSEPAPSPGIARDELTPVDLTFEVLVEDMASNFSSDWIALEASESMIVAETGPGNGPASVTWVDPEPEVPAFTGLDQPGPAASAGPTVVSRFDRLASAVRLTRQAAEAWGALIRGAEAGPVASR